MDPAAPSDNDPRAFRAAPPDCTLTPKAAAATTLPTARAIAAV
jgi:hypothetical protein